MLLSRLPFQAVLVERLTQPHPRLVGDWGAIARTGTCKGRGPHLPFSSGEFHGPALASQLQAVTAGPPCRVSPAHFQPRMCTPETYSSCSLEERERRRV